MRKSKIIIMVLMLCVFVSGCGQENKKESNELKTLDSSSSILNGSSAEIEDESDYSIVRAENFSEGFAWVKLENQENRERRWACIDKSGVVQFFLNDEYKYINNNPSGYTDYIQTKWHEGTCLLTKECADTERILNTSGNIIFETDDIYTDILFYMEGYYVVVKHESGFETNEYSICFLSTDGEWSDIEWKIGDQNNSVEYCGSGIICHNDEYFNVKTGNTFKKSFLFNRIGEFDNGVCLVEKIGDYVALMYANGDIKKLDTTTYADTYGSYGKISEGCSVMNNQQNIAYYDIKTSSVNSIFKSPDNVHIDNNQDLCFKNNNLFVKQRGADGNLYFTIYNKEGDRLFEPIKCDTIGNLSCERIVTVSNFKYCVYDEQGNMVFENDSPIDEYSDDVAIVGRKTHNPYYIDKNGNQLFSKISIKN